MGRSAQLPAEVEGGVAAMDAAAAQTVDSILAIPIGLIEIGQRQRPVDPVWAAALGRIMTADGGQNRTPIEVCRLPGRDTFLLVAGAHRLEGARLESWPTIRAIVVSADHIQRRMAEVSENLWRRNLEPIDRAAAVAELVQLKKLQAGIDPTQDGRTASANARWSKRLKDAAEDASATIARAYGWADEVAEELGFSRRTIFLDLELHEGLRADVVQKLRGTPVAKNATQLRALARRPEDEQRVAAELIADGKATKATEALALLRQTPKADPAAKHFNAFLGSWSRMSARQRRNALRELSNLGLPSGVTLTFEGDGDA